MAITVDHSQASEQEFELIPAGTYECYIKDMGQDATQEGRLNLNMQLAIRDDVDQGSKGRVLFSKIWSVKDPSTTKHIEGYPAWAIQQLCKNANVPNGQQFNDIDELCAELVGRVVSVVVEHEVYNDKERERVKYINASKSPRDKVAVVASESKDEEGFFPTDDTEIPF